MSICARILLVVTTAFSLACSLALTPVYANDCGMFLVFRGGTWCTQFDARDATVNTTPGYDLDFDVSTFYLYQGVVDAPVNFSLLSSVSDSDPAKAIVQFAARHQARTDRVYNDEQPKQIAPGTDAGALSNGISGETAWLMEYESALPNGTDHHHGIVAIARHCRRLYTFEAWTPALFHQNLRDQIYDALGGVYFNPC